MDESATRVEAEWCGKLIPVVLVWGGVVVRGGFDKYYEFTS